MIIRLATTHDSSGNPRRVYVDIDDSSGDVMGAYDEGYAGHHAVPEGLREAARRAPTFVTTPGEYRATLKAHSV